MRRKRQWQCYANKSKMTSILFCKIYESLFQFTASKSIQVAETMRDLTALPSILRRGRDKGREGRKCGQTSNLTWSWTSNPSSTRLAPPLHKFGIFILKQISR